MLGPCETLASVLSKSEVAELAEVDKNEVVQAKDRENINGLAKVRVPPQILRMVPSRRTTYRICLWSL